MAVTRQVGAMTDCKYGKVDLTGKEYRFAKRVSDNGESKFDLAGAGEKVAGVISEGKAANLHTSVDTGNQLKVVAGVDLTPGQFVTPDANGAAKVAATGNIIAGETISTAKAGELVEIDMTKIGNAAA